MTVAFDPSNISSNYTLSNSNKTVETDTSETNQVGFADAIVYVGNAVYWEIYIDNAAGQYMSLGFDTDGALSVTDRLGVTNPASGHNYSLLDNNSRDYKDGSYDGTGLGNFGTGSVIMFAVKDGDIWYGLDGVWSNSGDPANGTNPTRSDTDLENAIYFRPGVTLRSNTDKVTICTNSSECTYTAPVGFQYLDSASAQKITTIDGLYLEPDTSPYTSTTLSSDPTLVDGNLWSGGSNIVFYEHYAYGLDLGSSKEVSLLKLYLTHACTDVDSYYAAGYDSMDVFKSDDNANWTFVESYDAPPIFFHEDYHIGIELEFISSVTARYFKVVSRDNNIAFGTGGCSGKVREIEAYANTESEVTAPTLSTTAATSITIDTATLNGSVDDMGDATSLNLSFEYGTDTSYGSETSTETLTAAGSFSKDITGLDPGTTYHYRVKATDGTSTWYSDDATLLTRLGKVYVDGAWKYFDDAWKAVDGVWVPVTSITKDGDDWVFNTA